MITEQDCCDKHQGTFISHLSKAEAGISDVEIISEYTEVKNNLYHVNCYLNLSYNDGGEIILTIDLNTVYSKLQREITDKLDEFIKTFGQLGIQGFIKTKLRPATQVYCDKIGDIYEMKMRTGDTYKIFSYADRVEIYTSDVLKYKIDKQCSKEDIIQYLSDNTRLI